MTAYGIIVQRGFEEAYRTQAAAFYDEAFGPKLAVAIPDGRERRSLLQDALMPAFSISALSKDVLAGIAGFHTSAGAFTGGFLSGSAGYQKLVAMLGRVGGTRAALILSLYERKPVPGALLMDGIAVRSDFRGQGIGGWLLDEITNYAGENGYMEVRLDVIDTNPRARKLYERKGFQAIKTESFPYLKWLIGFGGATTMVREV
jgi:ribosomal protein S18 acetylase RimI-like enzyme